MHILKNGNENMQCCDSSEDRPSLIRHYPNPNRPCDFEGQPSVFEDGHAHSYKCALEKNWPDDWTMECLVCGYNRRDDFFSNFDDIAGCGERRITVGGVEMESPFSSPFYDITPEVEGERLIPLPRMRITDGEFKISGTDLCQALDLYPNVLSVYEAYLMDRLQIILAADPEIRFVIEMEILPQISPNEVEDNESESSFFANAQRLRNDDVEILKISRFISSILDVLNSITIKTTRPDGTSAEIWLPDPLDRIQAPPGMGRPRANDMEHIPLSIKDSVLARDGGICAECGGVDDLKFDRIIPHTRGGTFRSTNIQILCSSCKRKREAL